MYAYWLDSAGYSRFSPKEEINATLDPWEYAFLCPEYLNALSKRTQERVKAAAADIIRDLTYSKKLNTIAENISMQQ